jgi:hypothetical protein
MPISPYSTPIQFEYKPLGLEGFAKPLSEMQTQYDDTLNKVDALDFDIQALSKDDPAAKEKINALMEQRNQLRDELMNTKNFKQGARKVLDLNRQYTKDEDIQSIQTNAKNWQEYDKLEKERYLKGDISKEEYESNRAVRMGEYAGYKEGSIDTIPLSKNEEENIRKDVDAALKATADQTKYTYIDGIDEVTNKKIRQVTEEKWKSKDQIAREVRALILTSDKYKEFYNSRADLAWRSYKLAGKEDDIAASTYQADIANTTNKITAAQSELDRLTKLKESGRYSGEDLKNIEKGITQYTTTLESLNNRINNVQSALETGNVNSQVAKRLFEDQFLEGKVNSLVDANADLHDYNTVKQELQYTTIDDGGAGGGIGNPANAITGGAFTPNQYEEDINSKTLSQDISDTRKSMDVTLNKLNDDTGKVFGKYADSDNRITKTGQLSQIADVLTKAKDYDEFSKMMIERDPSFETKLTDKERKDLYNRLNTEQGRAKVKEYVTTLGPEASRLATVKSIYTKAQEQAKETTEYKNAYEEYRNKKFVLQKYNESEKNKVIIDKIEKYASAKGLYTQGDKIHNVQMTPVQISIALGYNSLDDAIEAGAFNNDYLRNVNISHKDIIEPIVDSKLKNMPFGSEFVISGTTKEDNQLRNSIDGFLAEIVQGGAGIQGLKPIMSNQWANTPGFTEEGDFTGKVTGKPKLGVTENGVVINIPISYTEDGVTKYKILPAQFPANNQAFEQEMLRNIIRTSSSDSDVDKRDRDIAYAAYFNTVRTNSTLTPSYADSVEVTRTKPATIYSFNEGTLKMKVVKEGLGDSWEKGEKKFHYVIKGYDSEKGVWRNYTYTDDNGKTRENFGNINTVRTVLGKMYFNR